jgi:hypothetical protein
VDATILMGNTVSARVLVAYATKLGSTAVIAEVMAQVLRDGGHRAVALPARDVQRLDEWDAVILGSAIYAAFWQKDARRFTERFHDELKARPLWLFSGGPRSPPRQADQPITLARRGHHGGARRACPPDVRGPVVSGCRRGPSGAPDTPHRRFPGLAVDHRLRISDRPGAGPHELPAAGPLGRRIMMA